MNPYRTPRAGLVGLVAGGLTLLSMAQAAPPELSPATFTRLHQQLQPPRDEAWREVPWKLTLKEAQKQAVRENRPVFMLVRSGHPLGCV